MGKEAGNKGKNLTDNSLNAAEAAQILGISAATVRNWAKLGKLKALPSSHLIFSEKEVLSLHNNLENTSLLKSRRNKTRSSANFIPRNYISSLSPNQEAIKAILEAVAENGCNPVCVLAFYAKELLDGCHIPAAISEKLLEPLSADRSKARSFPDSFKEISLKYIPGEDTLGMLYLSLRRLQEKKSTGSYYTPFYVADRLISSIENSLSKPECSICDPACGTGNFLLRLPEGVLLENIHGFDIDSAAIYVARINLAIKYRIIDEAQLKLLTTNIRTRNFLLDKPSGAKASEKFDVILGNPPWGYVFTKQETEKLRDLFSSYTSGKMPESFALFAERAINQLSEDGVLSFLLPETILSADTHRGIRSFILRNTTVTDLIYLGDVFDKVQCPSVILNMQKTASAQKTSLTADQNIHICFEKPAKEDLITTRSFIRSDYPINEASFHILADDAEKKLLDKILSIPHFTLKGNADFALGIVTGSNSTLLKNTPAKDQEPILKGKDIEKFHAKKASHFVHFSPETFQQCAPEKYYRADKKLFYRFIADEPIMALDTRKTLSLNSANILIPGVPDYDIEYILAVLNSSVISFFYKKNFKNLKVLRSYLEALPIAKSSESQQKEITEMVRKLECLAYGSSAFRSLCEELDKRIAKIYGIDDTEYQIISK